MARKVVRRTEVPEGNRRRGGTQAASGGEEAAASASPRWQSAPRQKPLPWMWIGLGTGAVVVVLLLAWLAAGGNVQLDETVLVDEGRGHVNAGEAIVWKNNPPASGTHYPSTTSWTVHTDTIEPGYWIHNLEHGGVVLLYKCPGGECQETVEEIKSLHAGMPPSRWGNIKFAAVPYEEMEPNFMTVAWNVQLPLDTLERDKVRAFYRKYVDKGPEDVP